MTAQELKNSILQLAVQGKLVPQNAEDEPAAELLKRIQIEKTIAVNAGIIKKDKKLSEITEAEIPYDIPDTWEWLRLGQLCQLLDGEKMSGVKYPYLEAKYLRGKIEGSILESGKFVKKGTRLILVDGENSGEVFFATEDGYMGSTFKALYIPDAIYAPYVLNFLLLKKQLFRNRKTGAAIPHLNKELFFNLLIPIPPLAEQERIVAKIEELLPLIEEYVEAEQKLSALNDRFPDKLRQSILQQAIQGKLTERAPDDEPAYNLVARIMADKEALLKAGKIRKEKALLPISDDEKPFEIPETWEWVRLSDICNISDGTHQTPKYVEHGVPFISAQNVKPYRFIPEVHRDVSWEDYLEYNKVVAPAKGDILMTRVGAGIGEAAIIDQDFEFSIYVSLTLIKRYGDELNMEYLLHVLNSPQGRKLASRKTLGKGASQGNLNLVFIREFVVPIPPLAEQQRIVDRVNELLTVCDGLKQEC
ncbi:MAG: restriction endonuclease subunit S [Eubacteriales bacterium]|nr:restriction endonuclease subunit S [Eubacteriales bacterium]